MPETNEAATAQPKEVTKADVLAAGEAYAEGYLGDTEGHLRAHYKGKIMANWYAGFLAHGQLMEPGNAMMANQLWAAMSLIGKVRTLVGDIDQIADELCKDAVVSNPSFIELKTLLGL